MNREAEFKSTMYEWFKTSDKLYEETRAKVEAACGRDCGIEPERCVKFRDEMWKLLNN